MYIVIKINSFNLYLHVNFGTIFVVVIMITSLLFVSWKRCFYLLLINEQIWVCILLVVINRLQEKSRFSLRFFFMSLIAHKCMNHSLQVLRKYNIFREKEKKDLKNKNKIHYNVGTLYNSTQNLLTFDFSFPCQLIKSCISFILRYQVKRGVKSISLCRHSVCKSRYGLKVKIQHCLHNSNLLTPHSLKSV